MTTAAPPPPRPVRDAHGCLYDDDGRLHDGVYGEPAVYREAGRNVIVVERWWHGRLQDSPDGQPAVYERFAQGREHAERWINGVRIA